MTHVSRRQAMHLAAAASLGWTAAWPSGGSQESADAAAKPDRPKGADRKFILAAGLTEQEADAWDAVNRLGAAWFALPANEDRHDAVHTIHRLQEKLLTRPTYRRYLEAAGAPEREAPPSPELGTLAHPLDEDAARAAGLEEAECTFMKRLTEAATAYRDLPRLHPVAEHEFAHAARALRDSVLARVTERLLESSGDE